MKRFFALLICLAALLSLAACAAPPQETTAPATQPSETQPTEPVDDYDYPEIKEKLTWEKINSFPIKTSNMTVEEMRKLCVDFFRFEKSFLWIADRDLKYLYTQSAKIDEIKKGTVYGGLPYVTVASGNVYRLMDYINEETGVVNLQDAAAAPFLFGNQCSGSAFWAWGRVINSMDYGYTVSFVSQNGFIKVGPYTYDEKLQRFDEGLTTADICEQNGTQTMYQSYAALQPADGLVEYTTAGHVIMCSSVPHVEYIEGTDEIDGEKSYITVIEQSTKWQTGTNESGDTYQYKNSCDKQMTFAKLFRAHYLPFTYGEFLGTDPVEETECSFSFTGDTITVKELFAGVVKSNYSIADIYASVKDSSGKEVYRHAVRVKMTGDKELALTRNGNVSKWGTLDVSSGEFTVEISVQLSTGERPTVYTGKLIP